MSTLAEPAHYTPEDLLTMPDGNRYELVDGQLVECNMSAWASFVAGRTYSAVNGFAEPHKAGWVFPEGTSYQCFPDAPAKVRRPDTSFIRLEHATLAQITAEGHLTIAPDLMVEVVSPNDLVYEVDAKVEDLLHAGTALIWVVNPQQRTVEVHRSKGKSDILREHDELDGDDVLPGFRCPVRNLFLPPAGVALAS